MLLRSLTSRNKKEKKIVFKYLEHSKINKQSGQADMGFEYMKIFFHSYN